VRNKVEDAVLKETLDKLKAAAPQRLKDLREENASLREKEKEMLSLKEEIGKIRSESSKQVDEIRDLREAEKKTEYRLQDTTEELERKKAEILNMRAEREVMRTGQVLHQELVDENLAMKEELDKLKAKDANSRKDLQDQLARACEELNVLRSEQLKRNQDGHPADLDAWNRQKTGGSGIVTV